MQSETNSTIETLWSIWSEIFPIGIDDDFFYVGGDSILAIQFIYRAKEEGLSLSLKDIFTFRTIRKISTVVKRKKHIGTPLSYVPFVGSFPLSPLQKSLFENWTDPHSFNQFVRISFFLFFSFSFSFLFLFSGLLCLFLSFSSNSALSLQIFMSRNSN